MRGSHRLKNQNGRLCFGAASDASMGIFNTEHMFFLDALHTGGSHLSVSSSFTSNLNFYTLQSGYWTSWIIIISSNLKVFETL